MSAVYPTKLRDVEKQIQSLEVSTATNTETYALLRGDFERVGEELRDVGRRVDRLEITVDRLGEDIGDVQVEIKKSKESLDKGLDELAKKLDRRLDEGFGSVKGDLSRLDRRLTQVEEANDDRHKSLDRWNRVAVAALTVGIPILASLQFCA